MRVGTDAGGIFSWRNVTTFLSSDEKSTVLVIFFWVEASVGFATLIGATLPVVMPSLVITLGPRIFRTKPTIEANSGSAMGGVGIFEILGASLWTGGGAISMKLPLAFVCTGSIAGGSVSWTLVSVLEIPGGKISTKLPEEDLAFGTSSGIPIGGMSTKDPRETFFRPFKFVLTTASFPALRVIYKVKIFTLYRS